MNGGPLLHLTWKEYRAVRGFWISIVVLVALADALIVALSRQPGWTVTIVYHLSLAAPAFFALGCAGAAFAMEREEGTVEFLRPARGDGGKGADGRGTLVRLRVPRGKLEA